MSPEVKNFPRGKRGRLSPIVTTLLADGLVTPADSPSAKYDMIIQEYCDFIIKIVHNFPYYYRHYPSDIIGLLSDTENCVLCMRRKCRERFPNHRGLAIPTCNTARAWRTWRDACQDRKLAFSFYSGKTFPAFPAHAQPAILRIWQEAHCEGRASIF